MMFLLQLQLIEVSYQLTSTLGSMDREDEQRIILGKESRDYLEKLDVLKSAGL